MNGLIAHARLVIDGHWLTLPALREGTAGRRSNVEIDEAARPKRITFDWYGGRALGVYMLDGDTFQFCYEHGGRHYRRSSEPGRARRNCSSCTSARRRRREER